MSRAYNATDQIPQPPRTMKTLQLARTVKMDNNTKIARITLLISIKKTIMKNVPLKISILKLSRTSMVKLPQRLRILTMKTIVTTRLCQKLKTQEFPPKVQSVNNPLKVPSKREFALLVLVR
jgi:hypothetical protein